MPPWGMSLPQWGFVSFRSQVQSSQGRHWHSASGEVAASVSWSASSAAARTARREGGENPSDGQNQPSNTGQRGGTTPPAATAHGQRPQAEQPATGAKPRKTQTAPQTQETEATPNGNSENTPQKGQQTRTRETMRKTPNRKICGATTPHSPWYRLGGSGQGRGAVFPAGSASDLYP